MKRMIRFTSAAALVAVIAVFPTFAGAGHMARPRGCTFQAILPLLKREHVGAYNWGFVSGKSQTIYPWDSWDKAYTGPPPVWFHDIFHADGTPYNPEETDLIQRLTHN